MKHRSLWLFQALLLLALDLLTKWLVETRLTEPFALWPRILRLAVSHNTGIAFSIPIPNLIMVFAAPVLLCIIIYFIVKKCDMRRTATHFILALFAAGALGNFINRIAVCAVTDFIDFSFWPSFNLADSYLTVGTFLLILFYDKIIATYGR